MSDALKATFSGSNANSWRPTRKGTYHGAMTAVARVNGEITGRVSVLWTKSVGKTPSVACHLSVQSKAIQVRNVYSTCATNTDRKGHSLEMVLMDSGFRVSFPNISGDRIARESVLEVARLLGDTAELHELDFPSATDKL